MQADIKQGFSSEDFAIALWTVRVVSPRSTSSLSLRKKSVFDAGFVASKLAKLIINFRSQVVSCRLVYFAQNNRGFDLFASSQ